MARKCRESPGIKSQPDEDAGWHMRSIYLKKNEDRRLRAGHLWIFSNEVDTSRSPLGDFAPGQEANVLDARGIVLGSATVNPASLICARLHSRQPDVPLDARLIGERLEKALRLRERIMAGPWYRLCHSEGDFLPGLVVDRFADHLIVQIGTAGMEERREQLARCLRDLLSPAGMHFENGIPARKLENLPDQPMTMGEMPDLAQIPENGCRFVAPLRGGQKTGWFYDQRQNRELFARYAGAASVLDICCYAGGFGVGAARHGARSVTFLDSSLAALDLARENMRINAPECGAEYICGDIFSILAEMRSEGRKFDLISLDPPALIKRKKDAARGIAAYRRLNDLALGLLADGGILASSSCSQHLARESLLSCLGRAAARRKIGLRVLHGGSQAADHPAHFAMPETAYLKCFFVQADQQSGKS